MSEILSEEWQRIAANAICHAADCVKNEMLCALGQYERPSAIYRPKIMIDGDMWIALYGDNLQDGIVGCGKSPQLAMADFDSAFHKTLEPRP